MIVLQYIANESKRVQVYVANHEHTVPEQWWFIESEQNPADEIPRGLTALELLESHRWLNGPAFLGQSRGTWTKNPALAELSEGDPEVKGDAKVYVTTKDKAPLDQLMDRRGTHHGML